MARRLGIVLAVCLLIGAAGAANATPPQRPITKADVLSLRHGDFYLHGHRFAEISFNKFDLFWELYDLLKDGKGDTQEWRDMVARQDQALHELHAMGFHSIRFFALPWGIWNFRPVYDDPIKRATVFYRAMDTTLDLCDKNDIQVVYSLGAGDFTDTTMVNGKFVYGTEQERELMADPGSRSRRELYRYIDDVVGRYKNRKTVLMWEISNETTLDADISPDTHIYNGQRMPTLADVAHFLNDVAARIHQDDPLRLVSSGGADLRASQWNQYANHSWATDTVAQQNDALKLLYGASAVDVLDIHYYINATGYDQMVKDDATAASVPIDLSRYVAAAKQLGKPLMVGETGVSMVARDASVSSQALYQQHPDYIDSYWNPNAFKWVKMQCDAIVAAGPQLVYWWEYSSDRPQDQTAPSFDIKQGKTDPVLALIVDADKRLKAKLGVR